MIGHVTVSEPHPKSYRFSSPTGLTGTYYTAGYYNTAAADFKDEYTIDIHTYVKLWGICGILKAFELWLIDHKYVV